MADNNREQQEIPEEESNAAKLLRVKGSETGEDRIHDETAAVKEYDRAENFWYHHKWKVIIVSIVLVCGIILGVQVVGKKDPDASILFAGPYLLGENTEKVTEAFTYLLKDYNGDGEINLRFTALRCYSDAQLAELGEETDAKGNKYKDSAAYANLLNANTQERQAFYKVVFVDQFVIYLVDPFLYQDVKEANGWLPLSEIFDHEVGSAIDDTGIRFADTAFAQYYSYFDELPEDTILCIRRVSTTAGKKGKIRHEYNVELFRAIVEFEPEPING